MKERLRWLADAAIVILLTVNLFQTSGLASKVNEIQTEQNQQYPTINERLEKIDSNINRINETHPMLKSNRK